MFGSAYFYVGPAADGRRFCWAKAPSFTCPVHERAYEARLPDGPLPVAMSDAAYRLGLDARWLARRIAQGTHGRARVDGKLTDRCQCGAKMRRNGFACWAEREDTSEGVSQDLTRHLGSTPVVRVGPTRYMDTKREAEAWARDELAVARLAEPGPEPYKTTDD
jgi:hypothetical protein